MKPKFLLAFIFVALIVSSASAAHLFRHIKQAFKSLSHQQEKDNANQPANDIQKDDQQKNDSDQKANTQRDNNQQDDKDESERSDNKQGKKIDEVVMKMMITIKVGTADKVMNKEKEMEI